MYIRTCIYTLVPFQGLNSNIPHYAYIIVGVSAALIFYILTILLMATILHLILKCKLEWGIYTLFMCPNIEDVFIYIYTH